MYKVIKLPALNSEDFKIFNTANSVSMVKCRLDIAEQMITNIDSLYVAAKMSNYAIYVMPCFLEMYIPRIIFKLVSIQKTILIDFILDNNFVIDDILLNSGKNEVYFAYTQAAEDNLPEDTIIDEFNRLIIPLPEKIKKIMEIM